MLKYPVRQACFVVLALAGLAALGQTPPVKKAAKPGQPVFADLENPTQTKQTTEHGTTGQQGGQGIAGNNQKAEVGGQKAESRKQAPEIGNQESPALSVTDTALAAGGTNATVTTPRNRIHDSVITTSEDALPPSSAILSGASRHPAAKPAAASAPSMMGGHWLARP